MSKQSIIFKIIKKIIIILFLIIIADVTCGVFLKKIFLSQTSGKYYRITKSLYKTNANILIFGSSRAVTNYETKDLAKKLNMSCYNSGVRGQSILFAFALQKIIIKRYSPKLIILNIEPVMLQKSQRFYDRLSDLYPYFKENSTDLKEIMNLKSPILKYVLNSNFISLNSTYLHILKYKLEPEIDFDGFVPLKRKMKPIENKHLKNFDEKHEDIINNTIDMNYKNALECFVENCNNHNIPLVGVISPSFSGNKSDSSDSFLAIDSIFKKNNCMLIDYSSIHDFTYREEIWADRDHLNVNGAKIFTQRLSTYLYKHLYNNTYNTSKIN